MKTGIHPEYKTVRITCACGRVTETRATVDELHVEICSHCHPFFTGRQKLVDTAGRVERFRAKYGEADDRTARRKQRKRKAPADAAAVVTDAAAPADAAESTSPTGEAPAEPAPAEEAPVKDASADETSGSEDSAAEVTG